MPAGESTAPYRQRDRNLEVVGNSTRLELTLGGVVRVVRRHGFLLLGIFGVASSLIFFGSSQVPKRYTSVAWLRVTNPHVLTTTAPPVDLVKEQHAVVQVLSSPRLTTALGKRLGGGWNEVKSITATGLVASPLIRLDTEASTPKLARAAADASANFAVNDLQTQARAKLTARADIETADAAALEQEVTGLSAQLAPIVATDPAVPALRAKLNAAVGELSSASTSAATDAVAARTVDGGLELYEDATLPIDPSFPRPLSWAIIGGLSILLGSLAVVYRREELVGRFRSGDSGESRRAGARILGVLPTASGSLPRGVVTGAGTTAEEVGLQLEHLLGHDTPKVVVLCGVDGAAPEATARRIAQAIAGSGVRVVLTACRPLSNSSGTDEFEEPTRQARLSVVDEHQTGGRLSLLDGGLAISELTIAHARTVLQQLAAHGEYVLIAAPSPTIAHSTLMFAELSHAIVMIAQYRVTKLRDAERTGTRLRRVGGAVLGVLIDPGKP